MQKKLFAELGISPEILRAVDQMGYEEASPIQSEAIPHLLKGSDLVGRSQTGSGKTAAFGIPAIECVDPHLRSPQVLVLCPTRELAVQVAEEIAKLAVFKKGVRELPIYGGASYERQFRGLDQGAQIVIGTPGRLMDHLKRGSLRLDALKMVVLDEADRMLDMGFVDDIRTILEKTPPERQTVCFSATFPPQIRDLIATFARDPVSVAIESTQMTVPTIDQIYYEVDRRSKLESLCRIIDVQDVKFGIVFCATKRMCDDLTDHLAARGYAAEKLHGDLTQAMRERVLARFKRHDVEFLIATDVAARGLDVDDVEVVFNYDLPHDGEDYVHRIGRTGRAGRDGRAITLVAGREIYKLQHIMKFIRTRIRRENVPTLEEVDRKRSNVFLEKVRTTLEKGEHRKYDMFVDRLLEGGYTPTDIASALFQILAGESPDTVEAPAPAPRPERAPRPADRPQYAQRSDRPDRPDDRRPPERARPRDTRPPDRGSRPDRPDRPDRPVRSDVPPHPARPDRPDRPDHRPPRPDAPQRTDRPDRPPSADRFDRPAPRKPEEFQKSRGPYAAKPKSKNLPPWLQKGKPQKPKPDRPA